MAYTLYELGRCVGRTGRRGEAEVWLGYGVKGWSGADLTGLCAGMDLGVDACCY